MKKTTSSLLSATAAFGLIAVSAGVAFASEIPAPDQSANPVPVPPVTPSADPAPGNGADNNDVPQPDPQPLGMPQPPSTPDPEPSQDPQSSQPELSTSAADQAPAVDQGGAGAAPGSVGATGVATHGQIFTGNGPAPVSARGGIRNTNAPVGTPIASNPTLADIGSVAPIIAGVGVIALADGVTLVVTRKRHRGISAWQVKRARSIRVGPLSVQFAQITR